MSDPMYFLDTNIFMYAAGKPHPYKATCVRILSALEQQTITAAINTEVLQELLYRYSHIQMMNKGIQLCRNILRYPLTVFPITQTEIELALTFLAETPVSALKPRDAIHAATMRSYNMTHILSADRHFDHFPHLERIDPLRFFSS